MSEPSTEFGRAVSDVLNWMGVPEESAAAALGLNVGTLRAMCRGIVPMRSLVIRWSQALAQRSAGQPGALDWWGDADRWLALGGYTPRREGPPPSAMGNRQVVNRTDIPPERGQYRPPTSNGPPAATPEDPASAAPAGEHYHPVYERQTCGNGFVHVFSIVDGDGNKSFRMTFGPQVDYKARAAQVKADLAQLTRGQFERKYGRFRIHEA